MKNILKAMVFAGAAIAIGVPSAYAGPVVIDGTDANDHGYSSGSQNFQGWLYMQKVLENLAPQVGNGNKTIVSLGTDPFTTADDAINSAFSKSNLIGAGWNIQNINGVSDITSFLTGNSVGGISLAGTGILYIPTAGNSFGDLSDSELGVINNNGNAIANFVGGNGNPINGGGLFAMGESPSFGVTPYGWLTSLIPTISVVDAGGGGVGTPLGLTADGQAAFPGLTNADLSSGPWHNSFTGNFGSLKVLAEETVGNKRLVILGGGAGTTITPTSVPEPASTLGLLAFGAMGATSALKRKKGHNTQDNNLN